MPSINSRSALAVQTQHNLWEIDAAELLAKEQVAMATKKRKYNEEYISYGFTVTLDRDGTEKP